MEISEIQKGVPIQKIKKKTAISSPSKVEDKIQISLEAEKRTRWVEMLKAMPDIRPEKMDALRETADLKKIGADLARKLIEESI